MGIDIGDLSAVMLASLPRTVASYLQRVGRAGRLTGNALNLAFVTGRGEHLPRLGDPLSVVNGRVRPPATYLGAEEILQRQYVAHLIDRLARDDASTARAAPPTSSAAPGPARSSADLVALAETDPADHLDRFLGAFGGLSAASARGVAGVGHPRRRAGQQRPRRPRVRGRAAVGRDHRGAQTPPPGHRGGPAGAETGRRIARGDRRRHARRPVGRRGAAADQGTDRRRCGTSSGWPSLEEHGVLPNYTLLDDAVTLDVAVTWIDPDTQEYLTDQVGYRRGSANALREFAPGAVFYAQGLEIEIDSVDLGYQGSAVRPWAFCPDCGYAVDRAATGTLARRPVVPPLRGQGHRGHQTAPRRRRAHPGLRRAAP